NNCSGTREQRKQAIRSNMDSIKSGKDLTNLFQEHFKETVQYLLQAEMDEQLGYEKHASNSSRFAKSLFVRFEKRTRNWVVLHTMAFVAAFLEKINNAWVF